MPTGPAQFICPRCGDEGCRVSMTRHRTEYVWRRRYCPSCSYKFSTKETWEAPRDIIEVGQ